MTWIVLGIAALAVGAIGLIAVLRRNDQRVERDDPTINQSGGPGFDDEDERERARWPNANEPQPHV